MKSIRCFASTAVLLALALARPAQGQAPAPFRNRAIDSLRADLRRVDLPDSQRVLTLFSLEQEYYLNDDATALRIGRQALDLARRQGFVRGEMMLLSALTKAASSSADLPQAERWAQLLQRRAATAPPTLQRFRIVALQTLANVAMAQNNLPRAADYLRQAVALLPLVANRPDSDLPVVTYYGLSIAYTDQVIGVPHPADSLVRQARRYTTRFATLAADLGRPDMLANAYARLGQLSDVMGGDSAAYYLNRAARLYQQQGIRNQESSTHLAWAEIEHRHGHYPAAIGQARQALMLALAVHDPHQEYEARDVLADALAATGHKAEAYDQARRARQVHDSTAQVNNHAELQALQVKFDTAQKEGQIAALTQQQAQQRQRLLALAAGMAAVLLALAAAAMLALRLRRSRALLATQHEELTHTRATQDRLYALVAHDLRSPMVAFVGLADMLQHYVQKNDTASLAGLGGRIRQAAQQVSSLLDNLLNWALSQRGELVPRPSAVPVRELLTEIGTIYQAAADAAGIGLTVEAPPGLCIWADPAMTHTILRNLTANALKATPEGGRVELRATQDASGVCLAVRDTGEAVAPDVLAQLNGPPSRLRVAQDGQGAGLGLLLSRAFAEAQGGTLALANLPDDGGTVATLVLQPVSEPPQVA